MANETTRASQGPRVRSELAKLGNRVYDRKSWDQYDTGTITVAGISELDFFKQPIGQGTTSIFASGTKTIADTNMRDTTFVKGENMVVYYVSVQVGVVLGAAGISALAASMIPIQDMLTIQGGILEITRANDAIALQTPVFKCPAGGGINMNGLTSVSAVTVADNNLKAFGNGAPFSDSKLFLRRNPIVIRAQEAFGVKIRWGGTIDLLSTVAIWAQVHLEGELWKEAL